MYRKIRSLHLCAGLFCLTFLVVYAVSAVQMTHGTWVHMRAHVTERSVALSPGLTDAREAARQLAERHGISGELASIEVSPAGVGFRVLRPGMVWQADYAAATGATKLRITDTGLLGALNRIHQMHGVWHEWSAYNIWVVLLAAVGGGILTLGGSGIYMWWKSNRDRRVSGTVLAIAVALAGGLAAWMRMG
jgi:hypothetical protein